MRKVAFHAGFGEREKVGAHTDRNGVSEEFHGKRLQCAFEVGKGNILVDIKPFDLMEMHAVRGVRRIAAETASRRNDADRRLVCKHGADLNCRGLCAEKTPVIEVKSILGIA